MHAENKKNYVPGKNSRGLPSRVTPSPDITNTSTTLDGNFRKACEKASEKLAGVPGSSKKGRKSRKLRTQRGKAAWEGKLKRDTIEPTKRQASKYKRKFGAAYEALNSVSDVSPLDIAAE